MKINYEIIRKILINLENHFVLRIDYPQMKYQLEAVSFNQLISDFDKTYSNEEILYGIIKLAESGYITVKCPENSKHMIPIQGSKWLQPIPDVTSITYKGHELLEYIENDTIWNKIKEISKKEIIKLSFQSLIPLARKALEYSISLSI